MAERERVMEGHRQQAIRGKRWSTGCSYLAKSSFSPPVYVLQCPRDSKMVRVWARYSDRMRANPIIVFIVSDPRIKEGILDDFGAAMQVDPANARPAAHSVSG